MYERYRIETLGYGEVPEHLRTVDIDGIEARLVAVAELMELGPVVIAATTSVIGGSCVPCTEYVGYRGDEPILVARPDL